MSDLSRHRSGDHALGCDFDLMGPTSLTFHHIGKRRESAAQGLGVVHVAQADQTGGNGINSLRCVVVKYVACGLSLFVLSACGGPQNPSVTTLTPSTVETDSAVTILHDPVTDRITIDADPATSPSQVFMRAPTQDKDNFAAYEAVGTDSLLFRSTAGEVAMLTVFSDPASAEPFNGTTLTRSGGTLPVKGSATYEGSYIGFLRQGKTGPSIGTVRGDVEATVSFEDQTFEGGISNRTYFVPAEDSEDTDANIWLRDVTFGTGTEGSDGTYSGVITDGAAGGATGEASYVVLTGSENAHDMAGMITLDHEFDGSSARETGGLTASQ
jgi:hypothetical protein